MCGHREAFNNHSSSGRAENQPHAENPSLAGPLKPAEIRDPDRPVVTMPEPLDSCMAGLTFAAITETFHLLPLYGNGRWYPS